jgi:hypothetical protein
MPPVPPSTSATPVSRRSAGVGVMAAALSTLISATRPARAAAPAPASSTTTPPPRPAAHPDIAVADPSVLAALRARDAAADFKCKGGMFDCDGDRRAFAKKQYASFLARRAAAEGGGGGGGGEK